jgi:hypothetical protein
MTAETNSEKLEGIIFRKSDGVLRHQTHIALARGGFSIGGVKQGLPINAGELAEALEQSEVDLERVRGIGKGRIVEIREALVKLQQE